MSRQLPLALRYPPDQRFETFVGAPPGALDQLRALAAGQGDWLYIDGASGTGKTHLALAACAAAESLGPRAGYVPLAAAAGRLGQALEALDGMDLVAIDGLEAIAGQRADELALFDFHNRARAAGAGVLYAATAAPAGLPPGLPDLRSRLAQCARWALPVLDDAGRAELLRQRAAARGLDFDDAALEWLLRRASRDLGNLTAIFERLDRASLAAQRRLTVPFLRQVLETDPP